MERSRGFFGIKFGLFACYDVNATCGEFPYNLFLKLVVSKSEFTRQSEEGREGESNFYWTQY